MTVDVAVNYYGKPQQTALTLASLLRHSGRHLGRIYVTKEARQPRPDEPLEPVLAAFPDVFVVFEPPVYLGWRTSGVRGLRRDAARRLGARYQYALETTTAPFVFVTHNDVVYRADLVGELLAAIADGHHAGAGLVGQCWNCPACSAGLCGHGRQSELRLSYPQALRLTLTTPSPRTRPRLIDPLHPLPLPECRLNEFACLLDTAAYRDETLPTGSAPPFGLYSGGVKELGCAWFRAMTLRGRTFANVDIFAFCDHDAGHPDLFDPGAYERKEAAARERLRLEYGISIG